MKLAESLLDQYEIPKRSTVHYAFHKSMKMQYIGRIESRLVNVVADRPSFAGRKIQLATAFPNMQQPSLLDSM